MEVVLIGPADAGAWQVVEVVVTAADPHGLVALTKVLVQERLAACGQVVEDIRSVYRWEDQVEDEREARVHLHTRAGLVPALAARVAQLHDYDVPCVVALPVAGGLPAYLDWVLAETREPG